jgi:hypothetical protein
MIDEYPILAVAAACAGAPTRMLGWPNCAPRRAIACTSVGAGLAKACGTRWRAYH